MSRTGRFLGGLLAGYLSQAVMTLVGLWLTAFLLSRLGQRDYGLWLVATQILGYLMLLDLGIVALLPREAAFATGRAGSIAAARDLPEIVGMTTRVVLLQTPVVALAALIIWLGLPSQWQPIRLALGLVMGAFVLTFPLRVLQATLNGLQDLAFSGAVFTATWLLGTGATVGLVVAGLGLEALAIGWVVSQIAAAVCWWIRLKTRFPGVVPARLTPPGQGSLGEHLTRGCWVSVSQIAQVLVAGTDVLIIGALLGPAAVVPYFCTGKAVAVLANQPHLIVRTAQPALSELRAVGSRDHLKVVCAAVTQATLLMSGAIACVVLAVNEEFVAWWVGGEYYGGAALNAAFVLLMLARHWNGAVALSIFAFGHEKRLALTTVLDGALTVTSSIALMPRFGLLGAVLGSLLGVMCVSLPGNLASLGRELGTGLFRLVRTVAPLGWRIGIVGAIAVTVSSTHPSRGLFEAMVIAGLVFALYVGMSYRLAVSPPLSLYLGPWIRQLRSTTAPTPTPIAEL